MRELYAGGDGPRDGGRGRRGEGERGGEMAGREEEGQDWKE